MVAITPMRLLFPIQLLAPFLLLQLSSAAYMSLPNTDITASTILNPSTALYKVPAINFAGDDISQTVVSNEAECAQLCTDTHGCFTYAYLLCYQGQTCYLKRGTGNVASDSCYNSGVAAKFIPHSYDVPHMKAACEDTAGCNSFSTADGFLRAFAHNATVDSWLSNSTCGSSGPAAVQSGSCFTPGAAFVVCNGLKASGYYTTIAAFTLPPFLIESACDKDAACVGFMTKADQTAGWLLGWAPASAVGTVGLLVNNV